MNDTMNLIGGPARAFAAGVRAADENPRDANDRAYAEVNRRLARLIAAAEEARDLYRKGWDAEAHAVLCRAIERARKP